MHAQLQLRSKGVGSIYSKRHGTLEPVAYSLCWNQLGPKATADGKNYTMDMKHDKNAIVGLCADNPGFMEKYGLDKLSY